MQVIKVYLELSKDIFTFSVLESSLKSLMWIIQEMLTMIIIYVLYASFTLWANNVNMFGHDYLPRYATNSYATNIWIIIDFLKLKICLKYSGVA